MSVFCKLSGCWLAQVPLQCFTSEGRGVGGGGGGGGDVSKRRLITRTTQLVQVNGNLARILICRFNCFNM